MKKELKYAFLEDNIWSSKVDAIPIAEDVRLSEFLIQKLTLKGQRVLFIDSDTGAALTADQVKENSLAIARTLCALALEPGDVAFGFCPNSSLHACCFLGTLFAGLIYTGCMWTHPVVDLLHQVNDSKAKLVFACKENLQTVLECAKLTQLIETIILIDECNLPDSLNVKVIQLSDILAEPTDGSKFKLPRKPNCPARDATCFLHYSSGSTGLRKGAIKSEESFFHTLVLPFPGGDQLNFAIIHALAHTSGTNLFLMMLATDSKVTFVAKFDPISFLAAVDRYKITQTSLVPSHIISLSKMDKSKLSFDLSSLEAVSTVGSRLPISVVGNFKKLFRPGLIIQQIYAATETNKIAMLPVDCDELDSVGALSPGARAKVVHLETGQLVGPNETGEILVKTVDACSSYLNRPEATKEVFLEDGWVRTGDVGYFDENGLLYLSERIKDMIKVCGCQVPPTELETILLAHPMVKEACVIAIPDDELGEVPRAFVVPQDPTQEQLDPHELIDFVNSRVADVKRIRGGLQLVRELPKLGIGKVDRMRLRNSVK